jgi:glycosyltransferase involved in cell wall biosynthesis
LPTPSLLIAERIVALSQHGRDNLSRMGLSNVVHIPQGIDVERWGSLRGRADQYKRRLGVHGGPVLLYPGHYSPGYGLDTLLQALGEITSIRPDVTLLLACRRRSRADDQSELDFHKKITRLDLQGSVRFFNTVKDMRSLIGASDLVLLPFQTMKDKVDIPTTLLEALAAGKPVIISDLEPMNELIHRDGSALHPDSVGLTVPPGDAKALADAVTMLLKAPDLITEMGQRGQALMRARFDIHRVARQYLALYQGIV